MCVKKGRSSSFQLKRHVRRGLGLQVLGLKELGNVWVGSKFNVADNPSRFVPLNSPVPPALWMVRHVSAGGFVCILRSATVRCSTPLP